jgi:hypothetical protein
MAYVLSFDISTVTVGYSIFNLKTKELHTLDYFKLKGEELIDKAFHLKQFIDDLLLKEKLDIKTFVIEESMQAFQAGMTNAAAMFKTSQINFLCQFLIKERGIELVGIHVQTARRLVYPMFHKISRTVPQENKQLAFEMVTKELGTERFPKKILKSGPRKGLEVFLEEAKDMTDAYILGKAYINKINGINVKL